MRITNIAGLADKEFAELGRELGKHKTLERVLSWAAGSPKGDFVPPIVAEVVTQDEFTHDVVITYKHLFLVYDTT